MAWECCDKKISTPFCPLCGKSKEKTPITELLAYVRGMKRRAGTWLDTARKNNAAPYHIERLEWSHKRWKRFSIALIKLMKRSGDNSSRKSS